MVPDLPKTFINVSIVESCVTAIVSYQITNDTPATNWTVNSKKYAVNQPSDMLHMDVRCGLWLNYFTPYQHLSLAGRE